MAAHQIELRMCDTIAIVGSDRVLFAKNSDRDPNESQFLAWQPRREYAPRSELRCTWITIPQVARTHAVLLSRPFWMWGAEMGSNEHGVTIGNEAVFTRERYAKTGLTGMDLVRLALERSETAEQACEVIASLLERHGQGGGCGHENKKFTYHNSFMIADPREARVLETAGRFWAVDRVTGVRSISNGLTIPGFAERYSDRVKTWGSGCRLRQPRTEKLAGEHHSVENLFRTLRDHGPDSKYPYYSRINGALSAPCVHAAGLLAASQTTASWVADLRPGACLHWVTGSASPCTSLFKPVRVDDPLPPGPTPADSDDGKSLWWLHERFARRVLMNPEEQMPLFQKQRDEFEAKWIAEVPDSRAAFAEAAELLADWTRAASTQPPRDVRPFWVRAYWAKRNRRAGMRQAAVA
jgi:secernin